MAQLRDIRIVLQNEGVLAFCARVWGQILEDNIFTWASALAYSWLFAIFPFLIALMSMVGHLPHNARKQAQRATRDFFEHMLPAKASDLIMDNIDSVMSEPRHAGLLSIGLLITVWSASGGMSTTMDALDQCYDLKTSRPYYRQRPLAIALTVVVALLILAVVLLIPIGAAITKWLILRGDLGGTAVILFFALRYAIGIGAMLLVLGIVYYFGPSIRQRFRLLSPGAIFSILVWLALGEGFTFYLNHFAAYDQTYGTVGGVAIVLLVFYMDAVVLLVGAEINSELDFQVLGVKPGGKDFTGKPHPQLPLPGTAAETEMAAD